MLHVFYYMYNTRLKKYINTNLLLVKQDFVVQHLIIRIHKTCTYNIRFNWTYYQTVLCKYIIKYVLKSKQTRL